MITFNPQTQQINGTVSSLGDNFPCEVGVSNNGFMRLFNREEHVEFLAFNKGGSVFLLTTNPRLSREEIISIINNPENLKNAAEVQEDIIKTIAKDVELLKVIPNSIYKYIPDFAEKLKLQYNINTWEKFDSLTKDQTEEFLKKVEDETYQIEHYLRGMKVKTKKLEKLLAPDREYDEWR